MAQSPVLDESLLQYRRSSSPFDSEMAEARSRSASKQFQASYNAATSTSSAIVHGLDSYELDLTKDNKENQPTSQDLLALRSSTFSNKHRRSSTDSELMPPPASRTPRKSPNKTAPYSASRPGSRGSTSGSTGLSTSQRKLDLQLRHDGTSIDDTCFSTFSEVPDLPQLVKHAQSPSKRVDDLLSSLAAQRTPRSSRKRSSPSRSPSPTPRRLKTPNASNDGTQTLLIDFTQQMEAAGQYNRLQTSRTEPNLLQHLNRQRSPAKGYRQSLATPAKQSNILNLLDFELPPAPTPRSIPTITVRELETLKSQYMSQISGLQATLSGREAEAESLKRAIGDAERRVGDAQQALKEEKNRREHAEQERSDWERRGLEVENVLNNVREEVLKSESEREELLQKTEELEKLLEDAESRALKAENGLSEALALRSIAESGGGNLDEQVQRLVASQIDAKIEAVSRELHAVYKEKHERKVATLKKSYEARSEKRSADLQTRVKDLESELHSSKQALLDNSMMPVASDNADLKVELEEHKAHLARIQNELATSRAQQEELISALEQERIEKGDLVAAVDEMLALQSDQNSTQAAISVVEDFRKSISRPPSAMSSGLRRPSESRIGKIPTARTPSNSKSRMLANIEKMGRTNYHDAHND
ncbi:hypothetical protein AMS68_000745 [Peltaster fructicola]|uniref:Uncharacterized protein n=1 Tax=Peltaster fructicola TaxID=286661 RepID=A0A6H0XKR7_9PEZI|nr:hypothetical protein AMS68_000745 [Peltaster fructicola]